MNHAAPPNPRNRRRLTRVVLGAAVAIALGASGVYIASAGAAETDVAGRLQAEAFDAQSGTQTENTGDADWFSLGGAAPTSAPTSAATTAPPSNAGWVVMDQAKWKAQLAEFEAMSFRPLTDNPVRVAEFNASCTVSHANNDDPIVFPNMPGASHRHSFLGNDSTDAFSTTDTLLANAGSSCKPLEDRSAYWVPSLLENGKVVEPHGVTVYYGSRLPDTTKTVPFPQGFRMVVGDAKRQVATPKGAPGQFWCAGAGGEVGRSADGNWPVCAKTAELTYHLTFPDCWDGVHLDSPDHKSHVGDADSTGKCSGRFPVAIPSIAFVIGYPTSGTTDGFRLSSGNASSMHGDAFLAWDDAALGHRVKDCLVQKAKCNTEGTF